MALGMAAKSRRPTSDLSPERWRALWTQATKGAVGLTPTPAPAVSPEESLLDHERDVTREEAEQLIAWIRSGELKPVLHGAFKLSDLHQAERYFVNRGSNYLGKIVIVPDAQWDTHGAPFAITSAEEPGE